MGNRKTVLHLNAESDFSALSKTLAASRSMASRSSFRPRTSVRSVATSASEIPSPSWVLVMGFDFGYLSKETILFTYKSLVW